jgi:hypothetical protein
VPQASTAQIAHTHQYMPTPMVMAVAATRLDRVLMMSAFTDVCTCYLLFLCGVVLGWGT